MSDWPASGGWRAFWQCVGQPQVLLSMRVCLKSSPSAGVWWFGSSQVQKKVPEKGSASGSPTGMGVAVPHWPEASAGAVPAADAAGGSCGPEARPGPLWQVRLKSKCRGARERNKRDGVPVQAWPVLTRLLQTRSHVLDLQLRSPGCHWPIRGWIRGALIVPWALPWAFDRPCPMAERQSAPYPVQRPSRLQQGVSAVEGVAADSSTAPKWPRLW